MLAEMKAAGNPERAAANCATRPACLKRVAPQCFQIASISQARPEQLSHYLIEIVGGRDRDRTCDPYDVNVVLSR